MSLPSLLAVETIADGSELIAAPVRNNFSDIQSVVNAIIGDLDDGEYEGDALTWNATSAKWESAARRGFGYPKPPRVYTNVMASGPPASPVDQDIWIALNVDTNGTRWAFQYNAGSSSAYKWEFIGGAPQQATILTSEQTASTSYTDLTTVGPEVTVARAGDYFVTLRARCNPSASSYVLMNTNLSVSDDYAAFADFPSVYEAVAASPDQLLAGVAAGATIKAQYRVTAGTGTWQQRAITVQPVRVS